MSNYPPTVPPGINDATTTRASSEDNASPGAVEIRKLLHDMNNGLEIIIQATYLIGTIEMTDDGKQWLKLLEHGVEQVANLNKELRDKIRSAQLA